MSESNPKELELDLATRIRLLKGSQKTMHYMMELEHLASTVAEMLPVIAEGDKQGLQYAVRELTRLLQKVEKTCP